MENGGVPDQFLGSLYLGEKMLLFGELLTEDGIEGDMSHGQTIKSRIWTDSVQMRDCNLHGVGKR